MKNYITLSEAITDLQSKGYTEDFNLDENSIKWHAKKLSIPVTEFEVDQVHRFEGQTNPDDSSVLYAISSPKNSIKGLLVDAYGVYSSLSPEMIQKLSYHPNE